MHQSKWMVAVCCDIAAIDTESGDCYTTAASIKLGGFALWKMMSVKGESRVTRTPKFRVQLAYVIDLT